MANSANVMGSIRGFLEKMKAMDEAIPEELAEDALEMVNGVKDALCEMEDEDPDDIVKDEDPDDTDTKDDDDKLEAKVADAVTRALLKAGVIKDQAMKNLDEAMEDPEETKDDDDELIIHDEDGEEKVTVDPEKINDSMSNIRKYVGDIKPLIANIKNPRERKKAADALAGLINISRGNQYSDLLKISRKAADKAMDSHKSVVNNDADLDLGKTWAEKYNPHYMKEGK